MKTLRSRFSLPRVLASVMTAGLIALALWGLVFRRQAIVVYTARSPDHHVLTLTHYRPSIGGMGPVIGRIWSGDTVVSELLLVDDETTPMPPRVEVTRVTWSKDSDLLGRCVIDTRSKEQAQRFVIAYMITVPGEFAHYPASSYLDPAPKRGTRPPAALKLD